MRFSLTDPIKAQEQALETLKAPDKRKAKADLLRAAGRAQACGNTYISSVYRQALKEL